jgi:hypothetical protein
MRVLAANDQRSAALAQYEICRRLLAEELGVEPAEETRSLYQQIREGEWSGGAALQQVQEPEEGKISPIALPSFLSAVPQAPSPPALFVARERELRQLDQHFAAALEGKGRVVLLSRARYPQLSPLSILNPKQIVVNRPGPQNPLNELSQINAATTSRLG